uniref:Uncharacterized protein n=1 Tax=Toxoplasma gondii COUG TaxID=1074873 RepID=A0A2G8XM99_TOXGO|nr:hypothetical protein TGCOUG_200450 [Toxoplasma gondii COUG]
MLLLSNYRVTSTFFYREARRVTKCSRDRELVPRSKTKQGIRYLRVYLQLFSDRYCLSCIRVAAHMLLDLRPSCLCPLPKRMPASSHTRLSDSGRVKVEMSCEQPTFPWWLHANPDCSFFSANSPAAPVIELEAVYGPSVTPTCRERRTAEIPEILEDSDAESSDPRATSRFFRARDRWIPESPTRASKCVGPLCTVCGSFSSDHLTPARGELGLARDVFASENTAREKHVSPGERYLRFVCSPVPTPWLSDSEHLPCSVESHSVPVASANQNERPHLRANATARREGPTESSCVRGRPLGGREHERVNAHRLADPQKLEIGGGPNPENVYSPHSHPPLGTDSSVSSRRVGSSPPSFDRSFEADSFLRWPRQTDPASRPACTPGGDSLDASRDVTGTHLLCARFLPCVICRKLPTFQKHAASVSRCPQDLSEAGETCSCSRSYSRSDERPIHEEEPTWLIHEEDPSWLICTDTSPRIHEDSSGGALRDTQPLEACGTRGRGISWSRTCCRCSLKCSRPCSVEQPGKPTSVRFPMQSQPETMWCSTSAAHGDSSGDSRGCVSSACCVCPARPSSARAPKTPTCRAQGTRPDSWSHSVEQRPQAALSRCVDCEFHAKKSGDSCLPFLGGSARAMQFEPHSSRISEQCPQGTSGAPWGIEGCTDACKVELATRKNLSRGRLEQRRASNSSLREAFQHTREGVDWEATKRAIAEELAEITRLMQGQTFAIHEQGRNTRQLLGRLNEQKHALAQDLQGLASSLLNDAVNKVMTVSSEQQRRLLVLSQKVAETLEGLEFPPRRERQELSHQRHAPVSESTKSSLCRGHICSKRFLDRIRVLQEENTRLVDLLRRLPSPKASQQAPRGFVPETVSRSSTHAAAPTVKLLNSRPASLPSMRAVPGAEQIDSKLPSLTRFRLSGKTRVDARRPPSTKPRSDMGAAKAEPSESAAFSDLEEERYLSWRLAARRRETKGRRVTAERAGRLASRRPAVCDDEGRQEAKLCLGGQGAVTGRPDFPARGGQDGASREGAFSAPHPLPLSASPASALLCSTSPSLPLPCVPQPSVLWGEGRSSEAGSAVDTGAGRARVSQRRTSQGAFHGRAPEFDGEEILQGLKRRLEPERAVSTEDEDDLQTTALREAEGLLDLERRTSSVACFQETAEKEDGYAVSSVSSATADRGTATNLTECESHSVSASAPVPPDAGEETPFSAARGKTYSRGLGGAVDSLQKRESAPDFDGLEGNRGYSKREHTAGKKMHERQNSFQPPRSTQEPSGDPNERERIGTEADGENDCGISFDAFPRSSRELSNRVAEAIKRLSARAVD